MRLSEALIRVSLRESAKEVDISSLEDSVKSKAKSRAEKYYDRLVKEPSLSSFVAQLDKILQDLTKGLYQNPYPTYIKTNSDIERDIHNLGQNPKKGVFSNLFKKYYPVKDLENLVTSKELATIVNSESPIRLPDGKEYQSSDKYEIGIITNATNYITQMAYYQEYTSMMDEIAGLFRVGMDTEELADVCNRASKSYQSILANATPPRCFRIGLLFDVPVNNYFLTKRREYRMKGSHFDILFEIKNNILSSFSFTTPTAKRSFTNVARITK